MMRFVESVWLVLFLLGLLLLGTLGTWDESAPFWYGASLVAIAGTGALLSRQNAPLRPPGWGSLTVMLLFYGYVAGRALTSEVAWLARQDLIFATTAVIAYLLIALRFTGPRQRGMILLTFTLLILGNVLTGLYQFYGDQKFMLFQSLGFARSIEKSSSGFYANTNHMAGFLVLAGFPFLGVAVLGKGVSSFLRALCGAVFLVSCLGIAYSTSRGGAVAFLAGLGLFTATSLVVVRSSSAKGKSSGKRMGWWFLGLTAGFALALVMMAVTFRKFYGTTGDLFSLSGREVLWDAALEQWQLRPFIGTGARSFEYMERAFRTLDTVWMVWAGEIDALYAHNDFLQCLADYGLIGISLALAVFISHAFHSLASIVRNRQGSAMDSGSGMARGVVIGSLCSLAGIAVHSLVDFNMHIGTNAVMVGALFGFMSTPGFIREAREMPPASPGRPKRALSPSVLCFSALTASISLIFLKYARTLAPADFHWAKGYQELRNAANDPGNMALWLQSSGDLQKAVNLDPQNPKAWYWLGFINVQLATEMPAQFADTFEKKAQEQLARSLQLYPQNPYAAGLAGSLADYFDEKDQADALFSTALRWGLNIQTVNNQFGDHLAKYRKDYYKAIAYYWVALNLSLDPVTRSDIQVKINTCIAKLKERGQTAPPEAFLKPGEIPAPRH